MPMNTRRDFLKLAGTSVVALAASNGALLRADSSSAIQAWVTSKDKKFQQIAAPQWRDRAINSATGIRMDTTQRRQEILGFGAAFTDASCYLLSKLDSDERSPLLSELFGPKGLKLSVCRTCIGASDYSTKVYSFDDSPEPDPELKHFSIEHDREYILPTLRAARSLNPDLFLLSSPWSPPGWMKPNGSMLGGCMQGKYFGPYADYFVRFLQGYAAEGVRINAVTVQNEVDTNQEGRMPAALWGQEYEMSFVKGHLAPALQRASLDTKIWILDHNYNLWGRALDELGDPDVNKYVDGIAWHGYYGNPDAMTRVHDAYPDKHCYWTEGGPDITSPDYATNWVNWSRTFTGVLKNWARCIVGWNLLLDENGRPNIGPFHCGGMVTVDSASHKITRSGQYWAFAHFSKVIQRGARVVDSQGELAGIDHVAFENPDGSHVLIVTNQASEQSVQCQLGAKSLQLILDPDSVTTLRW